jgi:uncharacterized membrane protein YqjE
MSSPPESLLVSLRGFATTSVGLLRTRLELFRLETQEETSRITGLLFWGFVAALLAVIGVTLLAVFITVLLWDSHRLLALGVFTALFLAAAGVAAWLALRLARQGSRMFAAILAELRRDEAALNPAPKQDQTP